MIPENDLSFVSRSIAPIRNISEVVSAADISELNQTRSEVYRNLYTILIEEIFFTNLPNIPENCVVALYSPQITSSRDKRPVPLCSFKPKVYLKFRDPSSFKRIFQSKSEERLEFYLAPHFEGVNIDGFIPSEARLQVSFKLIPFS